MWLAKLTIINSVACPFCGCLCDDIELTVENGKIIKNKNGCFLSNAKFLNFNNELRILKPLMRKNGELIQVSFEEVLHKSAEILANANYPVLYGWSSTSCEAQRIGVELAEQVGGVFDSTSSVCHGPSILSMQQVGIPTSTLGQVRHRADLIIYWGSDPLSSHPRHMQRYTYFAKGRFEESTRKVCTNQNNIEADQGINSENSQPPVETDSPDASFLPQSLCEKTRKLIVVDARKTLTATKADVFLQIEPNKDFELIQALRMLVNDQEIDVDNVAGVPVRYLSEVAELLVNCNFGILFFGMGLAQSEGKSRNVEAAIELVRDLNARTKFSIMPMRGHFNVTGANTVLVWQTGFPFAVDFSLGYPRYNPGETSLLEILMRQESDAVLVVASDPVAGLPKTAVEHLVKNPIIVIDPHLNATSLMADVVFPSAIVGIEMEGTAYRMDNVPLPLKKVVKPPNGIFGDEEILSKILEATTMTKSQIH
ncbi:MAG: molybdopterin-dependent oxidoreductase [Candidatus Bathyarchaeota archaeon]|nr:molybdopterin-dependent oxidoreductase [Candidatus Bathyarchaeota archaeon]